MMWLRVAFDRAVTHCVSQAILGHLVADMTARGHGIKDFQREYGAEHAAALNGNPCIISEWAFDIGGPVRVDIPRETIAVDDIDIDVNCDVFDIVLDELRTLKLRHFADGEGYYKAKFWHHATVLTPLQYMACIEKMDSRTFSARSRLRAFLAEIERKAVSRV